MKRREFVKKGSMLSTGILLGGTSFASGSDDYIKKNIKLAIIGSGQRGIELLTMTRSVAGLQVVALCDVLKFRLDNGLAKTDGSVIGYSDYREILKNKKIDAVLIATPFYTHEMIASAAIEAGKHVYCEKSLAKGISATQGLVKKVTSSKIIFQTGHQYHSSRLYQKVVDIIKSGEIGELSSVECVQYRKGNWRIPVPDPKLERSINWRMYREYSGGLVAELSTDQIDFVNWLLGENPLKIMGVGGVNFYQDGREVYDNTHLLFEYKSGVKASFKCLIGNIPEINEIKIIGRKGVVTLGKNSCWIKYYKQPLQSQRTPVNSNMAKMHSSDISSEKGMKLNFPHMDPTKQALYDFVDAIQTKKQPTSNIITGGSTSISVQLSLNAMYSGSTQYWKDSYNFK